MSDRSDVRSKARQPATHLEKTARVALLRGLNEVGAAAGRNRTIGQMTRGDDDGNAMLDRLALSVAAYMRAHPVPPSSDPRSGITAPPSKLIGHEPDCAVAVDKPCDCGGVWRDITALPTEAPNGR